MKSLFFPHYIEYRSYFNSSYIVIETLKYYRSWRFTARGGNKLYRNDYVQPNANSVSN